MEIDSKNVSRDGFIEDAAKTHKGAFEKLHITVPVSYL